MASGIDPDAILSRMEDYVEPFPEEDVTIGATAAAGGMADQEPDPDNTCVMNRAKMEKILNAIREIAVEAKRRNVEVEWRPI